MARRRKRSLGRGSLRGLGSSPSEHKEAFEAQFALVSERTKYAKRCDDVLALMRSLGRADAHARSAGDSFHRSVRTLLKNSLINGEILSRQLCGCKR